MVVWVINTAYKWWLRVNSAVSISIRKKFPKYASQFLHFASQNPAQWVGLNLLLAASYSQGETPTTIGAEELNSPCSVAGNGCDLFAIATKQIESAPLKTR